MRSGSRLERILNQGLFAVTAELNPPRGNNVASLRERADRLIGIADAVNIPDNPSGIVHMSSISAAALVSQMGLEPIVHISTRDRNRIALQSDLLGATALGIKNVLCLTGDHLSFGNQPEARAVYDLDSIQLVKSLRGLVEQGTLLGGMEKINGLANLFIGATVNPFAGPSELQITRLEKKIRAGADFIQTAPIYDVDRFRHWMRQIRERGVCEKTFIIATVSPLKSPDRASYLRRNIFAIPVPEALIKRISGASNPVEEGIRICVEHILELKEMEGINGIHVMGVEYEPDARQILEMAALLPRPRVD